MVDPANSRLSIVKQCQLLSINRSRYYYQPRAPKSENHDLMQLLDRQYMQTPTWGSRSMRSYLRRLGYKINRKRVARLMKLLGIETIYPKPRTSQAHSEHKVYPYLLRKLKIKRPNQVWVADITYVPMSRGFMYLIAVMDWNSRKVLAWRLSNTMDTDFCIQALEEAIDQFGSPAIFNTDQGAQFTSQAFTRVLKQHNIKISMDGRGQVRDNIFIERLWWTLKHNYLYLHSFDNGSELRQGLKGWFSFYNQERSHQSLDDKTPNEVYYDLPHPFKELT